MDILEGAGLTLILGSVYAGSSHSGAQVGLPILCISFPMGQLLAQLGLNILQWFLVLTAQKPSKPGSFQQVPEACGGDLEHIPPMKLSGSKLSRTPN